MGAASRLNPASHPAIARATVTRSTVRSRPLQSHQHQPSRLNRTLTGQRCRPRQRAPPPPRHSASPSVMGAAEPIEPDGAPGDSAGRGNSRRGSQSASTESSAAAEPGEPDIKPGYGVGHGNRSTLHAQPLQALWGPPSRLNRASHPAIARATVIAATPRTRLLRTHQWPPSPRTRVRNRRGRLRICIPLQEPGWPFHAHHYGWLEGQQFDLSNGHGAGWRQSSR